MHFSLTVGAVLAATISTVAVADGTACNDAVNDGGNYYCPGAVDSISYTNLGSDGTYKKITGMENKDSCGTKSQSYGGPIAPFNEEVSLHFRGPLQLKKLAVYTKGEDKPAKRGLRASPHARRHGHNHKRFHEQKRDVGDMVTATIDGEVVSWVNEYDGGSGATPAPAPDSAPAPGGADAPAPKGNNKAAKPSSSPVNVAPGEWGRVGFYDAEAGKANGLTFLNNKGGSGSGVFDMTFGNSLSFAASDGVSGSSDSQVLGDQLLPDNEEIAIMSDKKCDGNCGFVRPGTDDVAFHGFDGANKIFLAEFKMPVTGKKGFNQDMPAFWLLNAQIPRTLQYGSCSCWESGCGEFDILEVLASGDKRCKSTIHANIAGGDSHFFDRPEDFKKVAVVFNGESSSAHIKILKDDVDFSETLPSDTIKSFCEDGANPAVFPLGS